ncbi:MULTISPECIES: hypothetical protein [unclassified Streptomyces]|uniref:hypothetical protein n=1 Tax=unclassified Streptomyces TaxID=2593676 RepID=UPI0036E60179
MHESSFSPAVSANPSLPAEHRLTELLGRLDQDLRGGDWIPGPLEISLARRLALASADIGVLSFRHVSDALWEGSMELTYAGGGRLASLLACLLEHASAAEHPGTPDDTGDASARGTSAQTAAVALLERVADQRSVPVVQHINRNS